MSRSLRVILGIVLVLVIGAVAVAVLWPQGYQMARNWVTGGQQQQRQQAQQGQQQPPPEVGVVEVKPEEIPLPIEYAGRVAGFRDVEIRARVGGTLLKREFEEGAKVTKGQELFKIDPATYEVALAQAEAQLAQSQAQATQAEENYNRYQDLANKEVSSKQQFEQAVAQRDLTRAAVKLAQAQIDAAKLNIQYTSIISPVTGVTSLQTPPEGSLVLAESTVLTTITQLDPAYVNFSFTNSEYKDFRDLNKKRKQPITADQLTVELHYGDGSIYANKGRIDIATRTVDPQTGTIQARAIFPNPDGDILPGQFVRVAIGGVTLPDALVVPQRAVSQNPEGASVYVVGDDNKAEARRVELGQLVESGYVVKSGLKPGDRVVVDGVIRVKPGSPVKPVPASTTPPPEPRQQASDGGGKPGGKAAQNAGGPAANGGATQ